MNWHWEDIRGIWPACGSGLMTFKCGTFQAETHTFNSLMANKIDQIQVFFIKNDVFKIERGIEDGSSLLKKLGI